MTRWGRILRCAVVVFAAAFTLASANTNAAVITHGTKTIQFSLAPGASSNPITPVANEAVHVVAVDTTSGVAGIAQLEVLRVPGTTLEWVGQSSPGVGSGVTEQGASGKFGTAMVCASYDCLVVLEVNSSNSFAIHNASGITHTGYLTLSW